jgi:hypothetical protein
MLLAICSMLVSCFLLPALCCLLSASCWFHVACYLFHAACYLFHVSFMLLAMSFMLLSCSLLPVSWWFHTPCYLFHAAYYLLHASFMLLATCTLLVSCCLLSGSLWLCVNLFWPWKRRRHILPKRYMTLNGVHSAQNSSYNRHTSSMWLLCYKERIECTMHHVMYLLYHSALYAFWVWKCLVILVLK